MIKDKIDGCIKGSTYVDGSRQRRYLKDWETVASPTISLEALFATLVVNAHEGRDKVTFDAPVAFIHAELPKDKKNIHDIAQWNCQYDVWYQPAI